MTQSKFHKRIENDLLLSKKLYAQSIESKKNAKAIRNTHGLKYSVPKDNLEVLFQNIINDTNIKYSVNDFFKYMKIMQFRMDNFKDIVSDFVKLKDLVNNKQIEDETFTYVILRFYASNYDCLINFLKPLAKKIQSVKKYDLTNKNGYKIKDISNAESVEILFENFDKSFFEYFMKFFDRDLRNAIDHESYKTSNNKIMYKKKWINGDTVFKKTVLMGHFISSLQTISIKYKCIINQSILDKKIKKKEIDSFLKSFIV